MAMCWLNLILVDEMRLLLTLKAGHHFLTHTPMTGAENIRKVKINEQNVRNMQ